MDENKSDTGLAFADSDGATREVRGCTLTKDKANRYWLWSKSLKHNLAYKSRTREDCLLAAIDSLLFTISLRDEHISALQRIADLAQQFASEITPDENE